MTEPLPKPFSRKTLLLTMALLAAAAFALYARTLGHGWVWDDLSYAKTFTWDTWASGLRRSLEGPIFKTAQYYRPLGMFTFALLPGAAAQHAINCVLHALNTALVFLLARALMPRQIAASAAGLWAAALGALVFAAHPAAVESVAWVSGRFDTLMLSFLLACCLCIFRAPLQPTPRRMAVVAALFFAALSSKEAAVGLPVALPLMLVLAVWLDDEHAPLRPLARPLLKWLAAMALATLLYAVIRAIFMPSFFAGSAKISFSAKEGLLDKINIAALALMQFARVLLEPWSQTAPMHTFTYSAGSGLLPGTFATFAAVALLVALARLRHLAALALLTALVMGWPALRLIGFINRESIFSNRYALAPLALLAAALAAICAAWSERRKPPLAQQRTLLDACTLGIVALAICSNATIAQWKNEPVFWEFAYKTAPNSELTQKNHILVVLHHKKQWKRANTELTRYLAKYPNNLTKNKLSLKDLNEWAWIRTQAGDHAGALELAALMERRLEQDKTLGDNKRTLGAFWRTRGIIEGRLGRWKPSVRYLERAVQTSPSDIYNSFYLAHALHMDGQGKRAEETYSAALAKAEKATAQWATKWHAGWPAPPHESTAPTAQQEHKTRIRALAQQQRWDDAQAALQDFARQHPDALKNPDIEDAATWALVRARAGDAKGAAELLARAERNADKHIPRSTRDLQALGAFWRTRGILDAEAGRWAEAAAALERAVRADPAERHNALRLAQALHMTGQRERAEELFANALGGAPEDLAAWAAEWRKTWRPPLPPRAAASAPAPAPKTSEKAA